MSITEAFAIECAGGTGVTLYVSPSLSAERWRHLRQAVEDLPVTVQVLRLQLVGDALRELPEGLGELIRHWRELRRGPVHLHLGIGAPRRPVAVGSSHD